MIHVEGMGVNGALLAHLLNKYDVPFTWNDTEQERTAWKASTGCIYPSGSDRFGPDQACYDVWDFWHTTGLLADLVEEGVWTFCTKSSPHQAKYARTDVGELRQAEPPSFHLNSQRLVLDTRERFSDRRLASSPDKSRKVITHAGHRLGHSYWGWERHVAPDFDARLTRDGKRPAFYFREGRFKMCYCYPVPGTDLWYAGSSIIKQKAGSEKSLLIQPKYDKWRSDFERLGAGMVTIAGEGEMREGWRPAASPHDTRWVSEQSKTLITLRPLWNSGIRHFPQQWAELAPLLGVVPDPAEQMK